MQRAARTLARQPGVRGSHHRPPHERQSVEPSRTHQTPSKRVAGPTTDRRAERTGQREAPPGGRCGGTEWNQRRLGHERPDQCLADGPAARQCSTGPTSRRWRPRRTVVCSPPATRPRNRPPADADGWHLSGQTCVPALAGWHRAVAGRAARPSRLAHLCGAGPVGRRWRGAVPGARSPLAARADPDRGRRPHGAERPRRVGREADRPGATVGRGPERVLRSGGRRRVAR